MIFYCKKDPPPHSLLNRDLLFYIKFLILLCISLQQQTVVKADNLPLLSGTLRTYQTAACDGELINLQCPKTTSISVQYAQYGSQSGGNLCRRKARARNDDTRANYTACGFKDVTENVVSNCQKKEKCTFQTTPEFLGSSGSCSPHSLIEIAYKCTPSEFRSEIGCENTVIELNCNRSSRIAIYSAKYGRTQYESVLCPQPRGVQEETCLASYSTELVMQICHGKKRCLIGVDSETFGNICKLNSKKYLRVIYTCLPKKVLKEKFQDDPEVDKNEEIEEDDPSIHFARKKADSLYTPPFYEDSESSGSDRIISLLNQLPSSEQDDNELYSDSGVYNSNKKSAFAEVNNNRNNRSQPSLNSRSNETNESGIQIIYLFSQGILAYDFISRNSHRFFLYLASSVATGLLIIFILLLIKICIMRRSRRKSEDLKEMNKSSVQRLQPPPAVLTDNFIDELSIVEEEDISLVDLPSILKNKSRSEDFSYSTTFGANSENGRNLNTGKKKNEIVRFGSVSTTNQPRCTSSSGNNLHFFYD